MKIIIDENVRLTPAQAKATYTDTGLVRNGKPVFSIPTTKIISLQSAFEHKKLSDGPTFTCGFACGFSCTFCYVENQLGRNPSVLRITKETGLSFTQIAIEREGVLAAVKRELINRQGLPKYSDPGDRRVIFASPLVDVAANVSTAKVTIEVSKFILANTNWQIRLLSKSALLQIVAEGLAEHKDRVIFGLSTGTFEDRLATSFELHTSSPPARLRTLRWLQAQGFRTFGMICPSLPQENYDDFAENAATAIRVDRLEHVWAEVINVRGKSLKQTSGALRRGGFNREADQLEQVSGDKAAWEDYARKTFLAHAKVIPAGKLRFLQYVQKGQGAWWRKQVSKGAVLLGKHAALEVEQTKP
jgi:DNA repair photolyase